MAMHSNSFVQINYKICIKRNGKLKKSTPKKSKSPAICRKSEIYQSFDSWVKKDVIKIKEMKIFGMQP